MFKVIITGDKNYEDYGALTEFCDKMLVNKGNIEIVSGGDIGVDSLGETYAIKKGLGLKTFPTPWEKIEGKPKIALDINSNGNKIWKGALIFRNKQMVDYADALIVVGVKESPDTQNIIWEAGLNNLPIRTLVYK